MAEGFIATRLEVNDNLPAAVSYLNLTNQVVGGKVQVEVTWGNPTEHFAGVAIVRKEGSAPESYTDGLQVYDGTGTSCVDPDVEEGKIYFYRSFPYNKRRQIQTLSIAQSILVKKAIHVSDMKTFSKVKIPENNRDRSYIKIDYGTNGLVREHSTGSITISSGTSESTMLNWINSNIKPAYPSTLDVSVDILRDGAWEKLYSYPENHRFAFHDKLYGSDFESGSTQPYFIRIMPTQWAYTSTTDSGAYSTVSYSTRYPIRHYIRVNSLFNGAPDRDGYYTLL